MYGFRFFFYIALIVCLVIIASEMSTKNQRKYPKIIQQQVKGLIDRAGKLAVQANQDSNELVGVLNALEASVIFNSVSTLVHPEDLTKLAKVDYEQMHEELEKQKSENMTRLLKKYPSLIPPHSLAPIAGIYP